MADATIILVHGAFADASGWRPVFELLEQDGLDVLAPPNPLRGLEYDAAYLASVLDSIAGPVLLVGHSYGGAVITVAGDSDKVTGLVYVAGWAPDQGESLGDLQARFPAPAAAASFRPSAFPGGVEVSIDPGAFHAVFCVDLSPADAAFMAGSQRPLATAGFEEKASRAAWHAKPAWAVLPSADGAIHPDVHRFSYERAHAAVTEVDGASHVVMLSHPQTVADVVRRALQGIGAKAAV